MKKKKVSRARGTLAPPKPKPLRLHSEAERKAARAEFEEKGRALSEALKNESTAVCAAALKEFNAAFDAYRETW